MHCLEMINEIIFIKDPVNPLRVHPYFLAEAEEMKKLGLKVAVEPSVDAERLFYRGFMINEEKDYPQDTRYVQGWKECDATFRMSVTHPLIEDLSIPTFFVKELNDDVEEEIKKRGWDKVFIKNEKKSIWDEGELAAVWPIHSMQELKDKYEQLSYQGLYAIRKFLDPSLFYEEERYWIIMGKIFHRTGFVPDIVKEAVERLSVLGSKYYSIDAIPNMIVEVNPGESSDRLGVNSASLFASWWKDALK